MVTTLKYFGEYGNLNFPDINEKEKNKNIKDYQNSKIDLKKSLLASKYIGVSITKYNTYVARITYNNKTIHLGTFKNKIDAAKARDIATLKYYGEYGNLNFPNLNN